MIVAVILGSLAAFIFFCAYLFGYVDKVVLWQRKQHDRISKIEEHDHAQDSRLDRQQAQLQMVKRDLKGLGRDVGWSDDAAKTQIIEKDEPDDAS